MGHLCACLPVWALVGTAAGLCVALAVFGAVFLIPVLPVLKKNMKASKKSDSPSDEGKGNEPDGREEEKREDDCRPQ